MRCRATDYPGEFGPDAEGPLELSPDLQSNRPSARRQRACRQREFVEVAPAVPAGTGAVNNPNGGAFADGVRCGRPARQFRGQFAQRPSVPVLCHLRTCCAVAQQGAVSTVAAFLKGIFNGPCRERETLRSQLNVVHELRGGLREPLR